MSVYEEILYQKFLNGVRREDYIGPRWEYINPQGVTFTAFYGVDVSILRRAEAIL